MMSNVDNNTEQVSKPRILMIFGSLTEGINAYDYLTRKLNAFFNKREGATYVEIPQPIQPNEIESYVVQILNRKEITNPPIAETNVFPEATRRQRAIADRMITCSLRELDQYAPLIDGETAAANNDIASFLTEDWQDFPAGTCIVRRHTSHAILYFIYPQVFVHNGNVLEIPKLKDFTANNLALETFGIVRFSSILNDPISNQEAVGKFVELSFALLGVLPGGGIVSTFGAFLLHLFLPSGNDDIDWNKVFTKVREIAREEIQKNAIENAKTKLETIINQVRDIYKKHKEEKASRQTLFSLISTYILSVTEAINSLEKNELTEHAIEPLSMAITLLMTLYQEAALIHPDHPGNPHASIYVTKTIPKKAKEYADLVKEIVKSLKDKRSTAISNLIENTHQACHVFRDGNISCYDKTDGYYYKDSFVNFTSEVFKDEKDLGKVKQLAQTSLDAYRAKTLTTYNEGLMPIETIVENWKKLTQTPLPKEAK